MIKSVSSRLKNIFGQQSEEATRPLRVLVVDDEPPILGYVGRVLETLGYEIKTAESGARAVEIAAASEPFDALITDLMMPNMNGDELARRLRASSPDIKVLYLTGFSDQLFKEKTVLWDGEAFLDKPASPQAVREALSLLLFKSTTAKSA